MLHAAHILCLLAPTSVAQTQAFHLARCLNATLHLVPHPLLAGSTADQNELRAELVEFASGASKQIALQVPETPPDSVAAVRQYVARSSIDLVVTDLPPDQRSVPPLAADATQALIEQLDCPVFVVGDLEAPAAARNLLVPTDLSAYALHAFRHAVHLARLYDAAVHVLHVIESTPYVALTPTDRLSLGPTPLSEHRGRRQLRAFLEKGEAADAPVHAHLAYGDAAQQVHRFTTENDVDLLVLSSHGSGTRAHAPFGQVAERVLSRATCPLLLVRAFGPSLLPRPTDSESETTPM